MWRIKTITGTIIETSRFTDKPMHLHKRPVCNERRELSLATTREDEHGFVLHTKLMPARKSHCVTLVLAFRRCWARTTRPLAPARTMFVKIHPSTRGLDILVLAVWGIVGWPMGWLGLSHVLSGALAYMFMAIACRAVFRKRLRELVDEAVNELHLMRVIRPIRAVERGGHGYH